MEFVALPVGMVEIYHVDSSPALQASSQWLYVTNLAKAAMAIYLLYIKYRANFPIGLYVAVLMHPCIYISRPPPIPLIVKRGT